MKSFKIVLIALFIIVGEVCPAQVPEKPDSMMPIVDMAGIIKNDSLVNALNTRLDTLSRRTTNQIVVVTVNDLGKLEANQFATQLGKKWGIGDKKYNNGVVILIKPKNDKVAGDVFIEPGPGLEGALPDVECSRIVNSIMMPHLKEGDYAQGIEAAINYIEPIVMKEFKQEQAPQKEAKKKGGGKGWIILAVIIGAIALFLFLRKRNKKNLPQEPTSNNDNATGAMAATGAASALATTPQQEPQEEDNEPEPEDEDEEDNKKPDEPEPYKYKYGGGDFGGAGAGSKF